MAYTAGKATGLNCAITQQSLTAHSSKYTAP